MKISLRSLLPISLIIVSLITACLLPLPPMSAFAQASSINCGDIISGEFSSPNTIQRFEITLSPGDKLMSSTRAEGKLLMGQVILGPSEVSIVTSPADGYGSSIYTYNQQNTDVTTGTLSAYGVYTIVVSNARLSIFSGTVGNATDANTGTYQLLVGCRFANGTLIKPGDSGVAAPPPSKPDTITLPIAAVNGSIPRPIQCGEAITTEFTVNNEIHQFLLTMEPGDKSFTLNVSPTGDHLMTAIGVADTTGKMVASSTDYASVRKDASVNVDVASTGEDYRIYIANTQLNIYQINQLSDPNSKNAMGGVGIYTLIVSCKLKDGTNIIPDLSSAAKSPTAQPTADAPAARATTSTLDLTKLIKLPLVSGIAMSGAITSSEAYGYTLDVKANATLSLTFTRLQGNLNLGLAVLSADGKTKLYQSSLLSIQTISVQFAIPADGQYIIAVYLTEPVPENVEATAFTVQATLQ